MNLFFLFSEAIKKYISTLDQFDNTNLTYHLEIQFYIDLIEQNCKDPKLPSCAFPSSW